MSEETKGLGDVLQEYHAVMVAHEIHRVANALDRIAGALELVSEEACNRNDAMAEEGVTQ
tara:strand:+ start:883 stop:1062 length:180 start_codon:yes stop_codon:yes gene_type:complete